MSLQAAISYFNSVRQPTLEQKIISLYKEIPKDPRIGSNPVIIVDNIRKDTQSCLIDIFAEINKLQNEIKDIQLKISNNVSTHEYKQFKDAQKDYDTRFKEYVNSQVLITRQERSELKKTNEDILKKLDDQIRLNSQLCDRIFEMKEEKFREGR
jgi:hypothetical protein